MRDFSFNKTDHPTMAEFNKRFNLIASELNSISNDYLWKKSHREFTRDDTKLSTSTIWVVWANGSTTTTESIKYADEVEIVNGVMTLKNPSTVTVSYDTYSNLSVLSGKYFIPGKSATDNSGIDGVYENGIYYCAETTPYRNSAAGAYYAGVMVASGYAFYGVSALGVEILDGYTNSPDPNAYPPAEDDGYTYTALGQLGAKTQIATGSYTGTGTYGASNPNSLTFDFEPKIVIVAQRSIYSSGEAGATNNSYWMIFGQTFMLNGSSGSGLAGYSSYLPINWGNALVWWSTNSATSQLNGSGYTYYYVAIG